MKSNDIYLSGESYAGLYVPFLLDKIDEHNEKHKDDEIFKPNLKGMLVINGVTNYKHDKYLSMIETAYDHFLIDEDFYHKFKNADCDWTHPSSTYKFRA